MESATQHVDRAEPQRRVESRRSRTAPELDASSIRVNDEETIRPQEMRALQLQRRADQSPAVERLTQMQTVLHGSPRNDVVQRVVDIQGWGEIVEKTEKMDKLLTDVILPAVGDSNLVQGIGAIRPALTQFIGGKDGKKFNNVWHFVRDFLGFLKTEKLVASPEPVSLLPTEIFPSPLVQDLARAHLTMVRDFWSDFSGGNEMGAMLRSIPGGGGGSFTSKRETSGVLKEDLKAREVETLLQRVHLFDKLSGELSKKAKSDQEFLLFRAMKVVDPTLLKPGDVLQDIIPSSTTFSMDFALGWADSPQSVVLEIRVPLSYQMVLFSFPGPRAPKDVQPRNQEQREVLLAPSLYKIESVHVREGKAVVRVVPKLIPFEETKKLLSREIKERAEKEKLAAQTPKEKFFEKDELMESFGVKEPELPKLTKGTQLKDLKTSLLWEATADYDDMFENITMKPLL